MPALLGDVFHWIWQEKTKIIALLLVFVLLAPQPAKAQFIDWAAVVAAINAIGTAITNVIGGGLQSTNSALGTVNNILNTINGFFQNQIYPQAGINRARGVVGVVQGIYNVIRGLVNLNVASATLANPRQLETVILSRNPGNIGQVPGQYTTVYQTIPAPTDAPPAVRDMIDMTDATAQAALKKAIAVDAAADQLMNASDQLAAELGQAAPGTAPMIEAQSAAMLVKAHALTQSAMAELFRVRAIDMANTGAALKFNANHASDTRRDLTNMFVK
jgi:hypothetical protein